VNALTEDIRSAANATRAERIAPVDPRAGRIITMLRAVGRRWRARRDAARLSQYPDQMLKDIGVSRGEIESAVRHGRCEKARRSRWKSDIYTDKWSIRNEVHP
jgi:uncharacterized protein YjiS (DUF1127 family)